MKISIHALREEGDDDVAGVGHILVRFLSTPSARRATQQRLSCVHADDISIHALCEEGDSSKSSIKSSLYNFYPRPLRGGRPP